MSEGISALLALAEAADLETAKTSSKPVSVESRNAVLPSLHTVRKAEQIIEPILNTNKVISKKRPNPVGSISTLEVKRSDIQGGNIVQITPQSGIVLKTVGNGVFKMLPSNPNKYNTLDQQPFLKQKLKKTILPRASQYEPPKQNPFPMNVQSYMKPNLPPVPIKTQSEAPLLSKSDLKMLQATRKPKNKAVATAVPMTFKPYHSATPTVVSSAPPVPPATNITAPRYCWHPTSLQYRLENPTKQSRKKAKITEDPVSNAGVQSSIPAPAIRPFRDYSATPDEEALPPSSVYNKRGIPEKPFPVRLYKLVDRAVVDGYSKIVNWSSHGRSFVIFNVDLFLSDVITRYFLIHKFSSFHRQLRVYNFYRLETGDSTREYYHELFLQGREKLCTGIVKRKGPVMEEISTPDFSELLPMDKVKQPGAAIEAKETDILPYKHSLAAISSIPSPLIPTKFFRNQKDRMEAATKSIAGFDQGQGGEEKENCEKSEASKNDNSKTILQEISSITQLQKADNVHKHSISNPIQKNTSSISGGATLISAEDIAKMSKAQKSSK